MSPKRDIEILRSKSVLYRRSAGVRGLHDVSKVSNGPVKAAQGLTARRVNIVF